MPALPEDVARTRLASRRSAHLATAGADGAPHVVVIVFAVDGDTLYTAVDRKPKSGRPLRRLVNISANPRVAVLGDHYDDGDWSRLWWVRADGRAAVHDDSPLAARGRDLLLARYAQYRGAPPPGPVIAITVERWSGWSATAASG